MNFEIRRAQAADLDGIMSLMEEAKRNPEHPDWFVADDEAYVKEHLEGKGFIVAAVAESGELAGFFIVKEPEMEDNLGVYLDFDKEKLQRVAVMDSAVVGSSWRGNGLQGEMLKMAEILLDKERFSYLMCTIHPDNRYSLHNMQKHGYEIKKTTQCYGGLIRHILLKDCTTI